MIKGSPSIFIKGFPGSLAEANLAGIKAKIILSTKFTTCIYIFDYNTIN